MRPKSFLVIYIAVVIATALVRPSSQEGILIAHGDHIELVCDDSGVISVTHTILLTANITRNVTATPTFSYAGKLAGDVYCGYGPEILRQPVVNITSENGTTTMTLNFSATLAPFKFAKLTLSYKLSDLLTNENGTWRLRTTFNTPSTSVPEIVVKIPKPSQFQKLIMDNTVPSPTVFIEESHYYSLVYKAPLFTFGNTSTTSIDISYHSVLDTDAVFWYGILSVAQIVISFGLGVLFTFFGKRIVGRFSFKKKQGPHFEVFKDKGGQFRFNLRAANGETIASSESYKTKRECLRGIELVKAYADCATTADDDSS